MDEPRRQPPPWDDDPLSECMSSAEWNARVSALNWPDVYGIQRQAHELLEQVAGILECDFAEAQLLVPRILFGRCHSAVLAAMRLAMGGQAFEARPVLRAAIEQAWYALHIARDPAPPTRAQIWWDRDQSPQSRQACWKEFTVGHVRRTHETVDASTAAVMQSLYEDTITFGGHPNPDGVATSLKIERSHEAVSVRVGVLQPDPRVTLPTLKAAVDVALATAKTAGLIYPERFTIAGVEAAINALARSSAEVFGTRARALSYGA